ncbi:MAG: chemotaxis response regulator protein-glutamate methylesterase [Melioribacteraceae bacterium]|jgi:two-component system chemotaxis response regulator CheB|nr:chemotaxis response regulator protein-glutamate methylesterase [Melioribacteraceae bacterium]
MQKIKAVIVDDSAFMRKSLSIILGSDPSIDIVATGRDGIEAISLVKQYKPDILTLDIEMPKMDGLTALKRIMTENPTSVIMVSSLTTEGAEATLKALELGAVDFIPKEMSYVSVNIINIKDDLIRKVKTIVREKALRNRLAKIQKFGGSESSAPIKSTSLVLPRIGYKSIALGISTGGPLSLQKVIPRLNGNIRIPIFIVQHMPPKFTQSLAERLNAMSSLKVKEAEHGEIVSGGTVYIAPGGFHMKVKKNLKGEIYIDISDQPADTLHKPSVDVMIKSVFDIYGKSTLGIIMTGMGRDGLEGIKDIKSAGGYCLAQNEDTCVVYGMPKAIVDAGLADVIAPLEKIPDIINMAV